MPHVPRSVRDIDVVTPSPLTRFRVTGTGVNSWATGEDKKGSGARKWGGGEGGSCSSLQLVLSSWRRSTVRYTGGAATALFFRRHSESAVPVHSHLFVSHARTHTALRRDCPVSCGSAEQKKKRNEHKTGRRTCAHCPLVDSDTVTNDTHVCAPSPSSDGAEAKKKKRSAETKARSRQVPLTFSPTAQNEREMRQRVHQLPSSIPRAEEVKERRGAERRGVHKRTRRCTRVGLT